MEGGKRIMAGQAARIGAIGAEVGGRRRTAGFARAGRIAALALLALSACLFTSKPERVALAKYRGQMLSARDASGIDGLKALQESSDAVRLWTVREGTPDYVMIESRRSVLLFYIERDEIVRFERPLVGGTMVGRASKPIRADHYMQFANGDRERLARVRMGQTSRPDPSSTDVLRKRVGAEPDTGASTNRDGPQQ